MAKRDLWEEINMNEELIQLELDGFDEGEKKGKTMDVPLSDLIESLRKQYRDFDVAYITGLIPNMKKTLSDIRNVAGCIFLKLLEGGDTKCQKTS